MDVPFWLKVLLFTALVGLVLYGLQTGWWMLP